MRRKVNDREKIFAAEYVIDLNGTRAAKACGISEKWCRQYASKQLSKPHIRRLVNAHIARLSSKTEITAERVLQGLSQLAFSNLDDFRRVNADGTVDFDLALATRDQMAAVTEIRVDATGGTGDGERKQVLRTTFKLADRGINLERLGRHLVLFTDVTKHEGLEGLAETLAMLRQEKQDSGQS